MGFSLKKVAQIGAAPITSGASLLGGGKLKDLVFGKKDTGIPDAYLELDPSLKAVVEKSREGQLTGSEMYGDLLKKLKAEPTMDYTSLAKSKVGQQLEDTRKRLTQQGADAARLASQEVAKRGLGRSSVGLNAITKAGDASRNQLASIMAGRSMMESDLADKLKTQAENRRASLLSGYTGGLNSLLNAKGAERTFMQGRAATGRGGGLLGSALSLGGSILGAKYGGAGGAAAGGQFGAGLGKSLANF